jgi:circadian clock protein KaiB
VDIPFCYHHGLKTYLRLFIHGQSPRSAAALSNLRTFCREQMDLGVELEVVDVQKDVERAESERVLATPTLIRVLPLPMIRIIGDLSDSDLLSRIKPEVPDHVM